jgi:hypothetical protein
MFDTASMKHVIANLYSVTWREVHGNCATYRVLAMDVEDAMKATKPSRTTLNFHCTNVTLLYEKMYLRISETVDRAGNFGGADNTPYTNEEFWKMLDSESGRH